MIEKLDPGDGTETAFMCRVKIENKNYLKHFAIFKFH